MTVLILTHGRLAQELLEAARVIVGELSAFHALSLDWTDGPEEAERKLSEAIEDLEDEGGVLVLTDIYGGTPFRAACTLHRPGRIEVVAGVNLPMVVRLACGSRPSQPVGELADWIVERGRSGISRFDGETESMPAPCREDGDDGGA
ncbi:MAG: PTS fructose transporter subunit IIA [Thermoanaerobaculia bacterium]